MEKLDLDKISKSKFEEILKGALKFLLTTNAKGESFDYYDEKAPQRGYTEWLYKYLEEIGIPNGQCYHIAKTLAERGFIDTHPIAYQVHANAMSIIQIKISAKGIAYLQPEDQGVKIITDENAGLKTRNLILQNELLEVQIPQAKFKYRDAIIGFSASSILAIILVIIQTIKSEHTQESKETIQVQVSIPHLKIDTVIVVKKDSLK